MQNPFKLVRNARMIVHARHSAVKVLTVYCKKASTLLHGQLFQLRSIYCNTYHYLFYAIGNILVYWEFHLST